MDDAVRERRALGARVRAGSRWVGPAAAPLAAYVLAFLTDPAEGPVALFRAALVALAAVALVGGFGTAALGRGALRLGLAILLVAAAHGLLAGSASRGLALALLLLGAGTAAAGLAAWGRAIGVAAAPSGLVAFLLLLLAMSGLYWADSLAEALPIARRHAARQAVLHVDLALAAAYDGAGFDRLRAPDVYGSVPLASSLHEPPGAASTGLAWCALGLALAGASVAVRRLAARVP